MTKRAGLSIIKSQNDLIGCFVKSVRDKQLTVSRENKKNKEDRARKKNVK